MVLIRPVGAGDAVKITLSMQEQAWLAANPDIRLAALTDQEPVVSLNYQGKMFGILPDIYALFSQIIGHRIRLDVPAQPTKSIHEAAKQPGFYGAGLMVDLPQTRAMYRVTAPLLNIPSYIITLRKNRALIRTEADLKGKKIATPLGHIAVNRYVLSKGAQTIALKTPLEQMQQVLSGEADALIGYMTYPYLMNKYLIMDLDVAFIADSKFKISIGVNPEHPELYSILSKAIAALDENAVADIFTRWTDVSRLKSTDSVKEIGLTAEEAAFLKAHPVIRLGSDTDWLPVEAVDARGVHQGIAADFTSLIGKRLGVTFTPSPRKPWPQIMQMFRDREIDLLTAAMRTPEREAFTRFTRPYVSYPMVIISRDSVGYIDSIESLQERRVGLVEGYALNAAIAEAYPQMPIAYFDDAASAILAVSRGEIFAYLGNIATASHVISAQGIANVKISGTTRYRYELGFGVRGDWPELARILQKALDAIPEEERSAVFHKWIAVDVQKRVDFTLLWQTLGAVTLVFFVIIYWNWKLQRAREEAVAARAEAERERHNADAANQSKSIFLANMSHELRTPINTIFGYCDLLERSDLTPVQAKNVERTGFAAQTLLAIIDDILDFAKLEAGAVTIKTMPFQPEALLEELRGMFGSDAKQRNLTLTFESDRAVPPILVGDMQRIRQIGINLISNALKFTPEGSVHVTFAGQHESEEVFRFECSVTDTGIGIAPADQAMLFHRFTQLESDFTRTHGGTGLGLTISKELAELMGGEIDVDSEPAEGSTFSFVIPLRINHAIRQVKARVPGCKAEGLHLLVAEDNRENADILISQLRNLGVETTLVHDGEAALQAALQTPFDGILMDIQMPKLDGLTATARIRAQGRALPVFALSAHATTADMKRSMNAGMNAHLVKPLRISRLIELLHEWFPEKVVTLPPGTSTEPCWSDALAPIPGIALDAMLCEYWITKARYVEELERFTRRLPGIFDTIRTLFAQGERCPAHTELHKLKGSARIFGAETLMQSIDALEHCSDDPCAVEMEAFRQAVEELCGRTL